jgi:filamentous hemagglutinin
MGKYNSRQKKLIALSIIVALQAQSVLPCCAAAVTPNNSASVNNRNNVPVVDIVKPNASGLSHNKFTDFNVGKEGLVFNNVVNGSYNSVLAGQIAANNNLNGTPAKIILNEVTGGNISRLAGMMEIAGTKADLIIANPNGIVGNGFGFINTNRATLTTGTPIINNNNTLTGFNVTGGTVEINGAGSSYPIDEVTGQYQYQPVSKLDIYANAAKINAELWAHEEINVIAGKNQIDYNQNTGAAQFGSAGSGVNLDVGALGGMYAGKIMLVGTNSGLGVNVSGNIAAQDSLSISSSGKITFNKTTATETDDGVTSEVDNVISSNGSISLDAFNADIENNTNISARGSINIEADGKFTNSGKIIAGEEYEAAEGSGSFTRDDANLKIKAGSIVNNQGALISASNNLTATIDGAAELSGSLDAVNKLDIEAGGIVTAHGSLYSKRGNVIVAGEKVNTYDENLQAPNGTVTINETDPDVPPEPPEPEPPREAEEITTPDISGTSGVAGTEAAEKVPDEELALVADPNADGIYKPIIDHAANGVDLVQIAQVNDNGVSRNLYSDFNIKSSGLILNNATEYTKTQLGGYIDRNMFLAGNGARVILNEVTSSRASVLNGYLEVAGHKASVVIANANGISVNGLGFINTDNVTLASGAVTNWADGNMRFADNKNDIYIAGDGLNGQNPNKLSVIGNNITNNASEVYANELYISADGILSNTGKIAAAQNAVIEAGNIENTEEGYIEAAKGLTADVEGQLHQNKATIKAGEDVNITSGSINNEEESLISAAGDMAVTAGTEFINNASTIVSVNNMQLTAADLTNEDKALINTENLTLNGINTLTSDNANIYTTGTSTVNAGTFTNKNETTFHTGTDANITADTMVNTNSAMDVQGNLTADIGSFTNEDNGYLGVEGNADFSTGSFTNQSLGNIFVTGNLTETSSGDFMNEDGLIAVGGSAEFNAENFTNQNDTAYKQGSVINAVGDITINAEDTVLNRSSNIESQGDINITANDVINKKDKFVTDWDITKEYISYKIPHLDAPNYYDAMREFERTIHTGVIKEETDDANIIASGNINIKADKDVINHYSKIAAGKDLTVEAGNTVENVGYQGTIHHDDLGRDNHYWKYKHHGRWHIHCYWRYGTTVIPYEDHQVYDQEQSDSSERLSVMSGTGTVKIVGQNGVINKTLEADGKQYEDREKTVSTEVTDKLDGKTAAENNPFDADKQLTIDQLQINSKIYTLNEDPSADYLVETNPKYADYHEFLSSDYLLERVKADPEKVSKRLGDGYFEQQFVLEQVLNLTGKKYLDGYGSDMEQFQALMEAGATVAEEMGLEIGVALTAEQIASLTSDIVWLVEEEINGQKVLVPEVYLAAIRDEDLKASGALITGGEVELYSKQDIENIGTINADRTVDLHGENIKNLGGDITGTDINLEAKGDVFNKSGNIAAENDVNIKADNIANITTEKDTQYKELHQTTVGNTATITAGGDLRLDATDTITDRGGLMAAEGDLSLNAGNDIDIATVANEKHVAVAYGSSSAEIHSVENQQSILSGDNVSLNAGRDVNLSGTLTSAAQNTEITAGSDINVSAVKDLYSEESEVGHRGGDYYNHNRKVDETVIGTNITGKGDIGLNGENNINIKASNVTSEDGKISLNAGNEVNITAENEYHERLHEKHEESSGIFSSKSTDVYDYSNLDAVVGSNISGGSVDVTSGADTNITASTVVADNDVNIKTGGELNIGTQEQTSESEYIKKVKKSGIFAGGGFGITIGSEKQRDEYANKNVENVGSTVGSIEGSINLEAKDDANITGSEVIASKDINITGKNVNVESSENVYNAHEEHEYKRSGLTISVGGAAVEAVQDVIAPIERANQVEDNRLSALYGVKAGQEAIDIYDNLHAVDEAQKAYDFTKDMSGGAILESIKAENAADLAKAKNEEYTNPNNWNINIGFGTQHSESESDSTTIVNQGSNIKAEGDVTITSTEEDINIKGSNVEGENVTLNAAKDLYVTASKDSNVTEQDSESSSANIGVSVGTGGLLGVNAGYSKGEEDIDANSTNYNESTVTANKELDFSSGEDTNIVGGKLSGEKVTGNVGGDLNIESKQDSNSYNEESKSGSLGLEYDFGTGKVGITGGYNEGNIDSDYKSVTDQSGIYAGEEGFDIYVEDNTDLKGGIISGDNSEENKLSTGTLTYEDIKNEAEYEAGSIGVNVNIDNGADYNEKGVTPNIGMPAEDEAESTTKATVSEGEIEIRDKENQKQDLAGLNRDTQNALNKLGEIFDKDSIEERQELAGLFGELAYNQIHFMEGTDEQKAAYHALVGGIMAELTNGDFLAGASAAAVNKLVVEEINKIADGDPAMAQWLSAALGAVITGDKSGASIAASGTKNNFYHLWFKDVIQSLDKSGLDPHKAYAITISADGKNIAGASTGLMIGCYIALDPQNNEVVVFDTTGAQMNFGIGEIADLLNNFGVMITEVDFGNEIASNKLSGNTLNLGIDFSSLHIGGSISYDTFLEGLNNGNLEDMFLSSEYGLSNNTKLSISAGLSNTVKMGDASNPLTWTPFGSVKDESIRNYISKYPSNNYLIYQNNITKELSVIAKTNNGYEAIVGFDENQKPQWERTIGLPDEKFYTLLN